MSGILYGKLVMIAAGTVLQLFRPSFVEGENLDVPIHGVSEYFFHIVEMGLGHIDGVKSFHFGEGIDIMIASSAKMNATAAEAFEQTAVIRHSELPIKFG